MQAMSGIQDRRFTAKLWAAMVALPHTAFYRFMRRISLVLLAVRAAILVAALVVLALGAFITHAHAQAANNTAQPDFSAAYSAALTCWRANIGARQEFPAQESKFTQGSKLSFDAVVKLGRLLGYDNARLNADFGSPAATPDERAMIGNPARLAAKIEECQKLGLALR